jgi:hypothetical protein
MPKAVPPSKPTLPPVDPTLLENADPWVKLLFDRFDHVEKNNNERHEDVNRTLTEYNSKVEKVMEEQKRTAEDVDQLQTDFDELRTDVNDEKEKLAKVTADFEGFKREVEQRINDLSSSFQAKSNKVSIQVPTLTKAQQCSVEDRFRSLLSEAKAIQTIFVVGKVPDSHPSVSLTTLMQRHFEQYGAKLFPQAGKSKTRRFSVPLDKVEDTKMTIRHYNLAIRDLGYWVVQDAPPALRTMNSNAFAFFKQAKDRFGVLRKFRFEAEDGYLTVNDTPFLPVYLVPVKQNKWKALAALLTELVADLLNVEWLETATSSLEVSDELKSKWCAVLQSEGEPTADSSSFRGDPLTNDAEEESPMEEESINGPTGGG